MAGCGPAGSAAFSRPERSPSRPRSPDGGDLSSRRAHLHGRKRTVVSISSRTRATASSVCWVSSAVVWCDSENRTAQWAAAEDRPMAMRTRVGSGLPTALGPHPFHGAAKPMFGVDDLGGVAAAAAQHAERMAFVGCDRLQPAVPQLELHPASGGAYATDALDDPPRWLGRRRIVDQRTSHHTVEIATHRC